MTSAILNLARKVDNLSLQHSEVNKRSETEEIQVNVKNYSETQRGFTDKYLCKTSYGRQI